MGSRVRGSAAGKLQERQRPRGNKGAAVSWSRASKPLPAPDGSVQPPPQSSGRRAAPEQGRAVEGPRGAGDASRLSEAGG